MRFLLAASMLLATPAMAETTIINFDEMISEDGINIPTYQSAGYQFTAISNPTPTYFYFKPEASRAFGWIADPDGQTMTNDIFDSTFRLSRIDGGLFDLSSFDIADLFNDPSRQLSLGVTFLTDQGSSTANYQTDLNIGLQTILTDRTSLRLADFTVQGSMQFDNFRLTSGSVEAAIPEPSTWATMILGIGLAGGAMRRRSTTLRFRLA